MKKNINLLWNGFLILFLSSCAQVVVDYGIKTQNSGNIVIQTNYPIRTNLTLNDSLLVNERRVKRIIIKNVPIGTAHLHLSANSQYYQNVIDHKLQVNVEKGKTKTQLITVPLKSNGYWISQSLTIFGLLTLPIWFTPN